MENEFSENTAAKSSVSKTASAVRSALTRNPDRPKRSSDDGRQGHVIRSDGEYAHIGVCIDASADQKNASFWAVGQLITIHVGTSRVAGFICEVFVEDTQWASDQTNKLTVKVEMVGEIVCNEAGEPVSFSSGIRAYPQMGCPAHRIEAVDLEKIYRSESDAVIEIGNLTQDASVSAKIDVDSLLSRHFALVGSTGVGKSSAVSLLLRKIVKVRPEIRVLVLDPHNEFGTAFSDEASVLDASKLILPFWLFKLDELAEVVFRGQKGFDAEIELLRDLIPLARERYRLEDQPRRALESKKFKRSGITADLPMPYRLTDLHKLIDERLGLLDGKAEKPVLKSLQYRLQSIANDPRFRFMFDVAHGGDNMRQIVASIFRIPQNEQPICVLEMSGLPSEVVNSVVSVLCRMAFELALYSHGAIQTLVVCEEAHRYIPADLATGFLPTRQSIARIAKEGRKYGVYLGVVTQRPSELDPTILSQCNSVFAMRLGNQRDQEIIRRAVTSGAKSTIDFLPSIANREAIAFGEALHTPMRLTFETVEEAHLPGARNYEEQENVRKGRSVSLDAVLRRMRRHADFSEGREEYGSDQQSPKAPIKGNSEINAFPGDEINSILNAAYTGMSNKPRAVGGTSATSSATPNRDTPRPGGSSSLIRSFRSK